jgi:hypothetical protein
MGIFSLACSDFYEFLELNEIECVSDLVLYEFIVP